MLLIGFIVPRSPQQSPIVPRSAPQSLAVPCSPQQSPTVPNSPLQSSTLKCLTLQGPPSSIRTTVLRFEGRVWTALCRPVPSGALGSRPAEPLQTLSVNEVVGATSPILLAKCQSFKRIPTPHRLQRCYLFPRFKGRDSTSCPCIKVELVEKPVLEEEYNH